MTNVLVTGGAGFIGANLCKKLLGLHYRVYAIDNFITSTGDNVRDLLKNPNFIFIKHDITRKLPDLPAFNWLFHLACPTGVPNLVKLANEMLLTCSIGTKNVLELAKKNSAKVLFTSSSEVYGNPLVHPQTESYTGNVDTTGIRSPYEEGKRFSESLCIMYGRKFGIDVRIARIFNTYGPHMSLSDTRVIPAMISQIKEGKPLTIQGDGKQSRTFCCVDDLVSGLLIIMKKGKGGEVYNLGSDKQTTINELAELLIRVSKKKLHVTYTPRPPHDHNSRLPSLDKVKALGWQQKISLEEGLKKTLKWYGVVMS